MAVQINLSNEEFQPEKQRLPDNYLSFVPKTGTTNFDMHQMFEIAIPRTNHILRLNKGYFQVEMTLNLKRNSAHANDSKWFVGFNNAACIFDEVQIKNNGRTILSDTYSQVTARLWQMTKSKEYLDSMPHCFLNYRDIRKNVGFTYVCVNDIKTTASTTGAVDVTFRMRIPIGAVFPCFDNCDNFYTTGLVDDIIMSLQLSNPYKYLTLVEVNTDFSVKQVAKYTGTEQTIMPTTTDGKPDNKRSLTFIENGHYLTYDSDSDKYHISKFKMNVPCHYPTPDEKEAFSQLINGGSVSYQFKSWEIDQFDVNLQKTDGAVIANFASNAPNIFGLMIMFASDDNRVVYEKPYISDIECNLNEIIKLANNRVHTDKTYDGDQDMYRDFCNNVGGDIFKHLSRFDSAITHDYANRDMTSRDFWGSYCQWYQIAAGNQLGFSGDYFANLINYKCISNYNYRDSAGTNHTAAGNRESAKIICSSLSQRMLLFKDGGLAIITPFSEEINMRNVMNNENDSNANHGLPLAAIGAIARPVGTAAKGLFGWIRGLVEKSRANKNTTYAYTTLGKDGYENHRDIIEMNQAMKPRKFREFIDRLSAANHGLLPRHGLGTNGYEGGLNAPISTATGIPKAKDVLGETNTNTNIDNEKGLTLDDLNLPETFNHTYQLQVYSKDYRNLVQLDYKFGWNREKIKLMSYGNEMSMGNMNHGIRSWLRDKWSRFKSWIRGNGKKALENLKENAKEIIKTYVNDILSGKINIKDVPSKFKSQVEQMIRNGNFTGSDFDKLGQDAMDYYHKLKSGQIKASQIPKEIFDKIKDLSISMNNNNSKHGLLPRHGFLAPMKIHSSAPNANMKTRISLMLEKNPALLTQKELRKMFMFKYLKQHKNDGHGISRETWRKLKYGNHKVGRPIPIQQPDIHRMLRLGTPACGITIPRPSVTDDSNVGDTIAHGKSNEFRLCDPKTPWQKRDEEIRRKYKKLKALMKSSSPVEVVTENKTNDNHGVLENEMKEKYKNMIRNLVHRKLGKLGFAKAADAPHGLVSHITNKFVKKYMKRGKPWLKMKHQKAIAAEKPS